MSTRVGIVACLICCLVARAPAQGSPYLSLDDPRLALLEHLIARGAVQDPSPNIRPLLQRDVLKALREAAAYPAGASAVVIRRLIAAWDLPESEAWWRIAPRGGFQAYTHGGRRELLQAEGDGNATFYADAAFVLVLGPVTLSARPAAENRLRYDPEYRPREPNAGFNQLYRFVEGYGTVRWKWGGVHFGQVPRNWGPVGLTGMAIGNEGYPRTDIAYWFGNRTIRFEGISGPLSAGVNDSAQTVSRWFTMHRLNIRVHPTLDLAIWEAGVIQRSFGKSDFAMFNPLLLIGFGTQFGFGDDRNALLGGDLSWRPTPRLLIQAQGALDDWEFSASAPNPSRLGFGLAASGALGRSLSWRASYALNSSLLYQTFDSSENFTDAGVGVGRNFIDNDQLSLSVGVPLRGNWLVSPQVQLLRQGEGRIDQPWPDPPLADTLPVLFSGHRRDTWQIAVAVSGQQGGVALSGMGGFQQIRNAGHMPGVNETRFVGRLQATIGFRVGGSLRDSP